MIVTLSRKLTSYFILHFEVAEDDREVYNYFFEIILSSLINLLMALSIGLFSGKFLETLIFVFVFVFMRSLCGGYHANTHLKCILTFSSGLVLLVTALYFVPEGLAKILAFTSVVFSFVTVWLLAPVASPAKPLSEEKRSKLKKQSKVWITIFSIAIVFLLRFHMINNFVFPIAYGLFSVAGSMVVEKIKTTWEGHNSGANKNN